MGQSTRRSSRVSNMKLTLAALLLLAFIGPLESCTAVGGIGSGGCPRSCFLHLSSCKLCLHHHLHLHPRHHWHLLVGFPNDNEDVRGMLRSRIGSERPSDDNHHGNYQRNHLSYRSFGIKKNYVSINANCAEFTKLN